jgi:membrane-associated phospholipid phosphatase
MALFFPAMNAHHFYANAESLKGAFTPEFNGQTAAPVLWARDYLSNSGATFNDLRIITFPSFHAAMAVIFMGAASAIPVLRWPFIVLNVLLLAATPPIGSHYLFDVIIGSLIGLLSWYAARAFLRSVGDANSGSGASQAGSLAKSRWRVLHSAAGSDRQSARLSVS